MKLSRIYNSAEEAESAAAALRKAGFRAGDIELVTAEKGWISAAMLREKGVAGGHAEADAAALREGKVMLLVSPLLGYAKLATYILGEDGGAVNPEYVDEWGDAAPLSGALGWPLLLNEPAPFSKFLNWPALAKRYWFFSNIFGLKLLTNTEAPVVSAKAAGVVNNPAPLSSLLRLPVLLKK